MAITAPVAFPLFGIVNGKCACGNDACGRIGKHPRVAWGDLKAGDPVPLPEPGAGYGLKTGAAPKGSGVFVVDLDGPDAAESFAALGAIPETYTVQTPRGAHLYFAHPGFPVKNSAGELGKGIDIRGDGGFVVGPGSPHKSGGVYELISSDDPAPAPAWLLERLRAQPAPTPAQDYAGDVADPAQRALNVALGIKACREFPPSVEGQGGDLALWRLVQHLAWDLALPETDVQRIVAEHFDPRCVPPWGAQLAERVHHKVTNAKTGSTRPRAEPIPVELLAAGPLVVEPTRIDIPATIGPKPKSAGIFWDEWDAEIEPPTWLVDTLIPVSTVGAFVAHGSSLKTWTMLSAGAAIAQGVPWLDKFATRRGRVLVLDYESGLYELRRRVHILEGGRVPGLGAWPFPDKRIDDVETWKHLAGIEGVTLLCIDSLAAGMTPGVDENSREAARALELAARYSEGTGSSVLFIHHAKKDDGGDARKAVRGSTAIFAAMDWCYAFESLEETSQHKRMLMSCIKPCMGPKPEPIPIELTDLNGLQIFGGTTPPVDRDASDAEVRSRILLALQSGPIETKKKIAKAARMSYPRALEEIEALTVKQEIIHIKGVGFTLDDLKSRAARVADVVNANLHRTEAQIAKAAYVETNFVKELIASGTITKSAEGRFFMTQ